MMKKVLITGADSYIGTSFEKYIKENYPDDYLIDTMDMLDSSWRDKDFSGYDAVFHVAGIAHIKETKKNAHLYYEVNRDLTIDVAKKAKENGVKQFIYLSSMSVYGIENGVITKDTIPHPKTNYGKSKLEAENEIIKLEDDTFKVCILRPPMVYGKGCKGNYQSVVKIVKKSFIFPQIENKRSMIYIDNLCEFLKLCTDKKSRGVYFPQNREYMNTTRMGKIIAEKLDKKIFCSRILGAIVAVIKPFLKVAQKGFGTLIYDNTEEYEFVYCVTDTIESILKSI